MTVGTKAEYSAKLHSWLNEQQVERERLLATKLGKCCVAIKSRIA
jgi:hypothetical protein